MSYNKLIVSICSFKEKFYLNILNIGNDFPAEQFEYASKAKTLLFEQLGYTPKAHIITYGCQQNVSDSERIKGLLELMGYDFTDDIQEADFVLFNTCAVRGHAEDRVYGNVGAMKHYKRRKPTMLIAVCGCMAQQEQVKERFRKSYPYVDIVFGTQVQHRLPEFIYKRISGSSRIFATDLDNGAIVEGVPIRRDSTFKGWLPIMYGCNNFCTYCIVPYVRGRERSRNPEEVIAEAEKMIKSGFKEIMLLGQNVNSYGKGEEHGVNFAKLLRRINDIEGDFRIRFMTSHPKDCTLELLDAIKDCDKVAKHLHLPFQSGSDRILKEMNRHYNRETYLNLIKEAKKRIPDISLTSDIIVGFPGETYEDFCETLSLVKEVEYTSLFTFIFSPREGTPAAKMEDNISRVEKGKWFNELLKLQEEIGEEKIKNTVGKTYRVLCEESIGDGLYSGRTDGMHIVQFESNSDLIGQLVNVKIDSYTNVLTGTVVE